MMKRPLLTRFDSFPLLIWSLAENGRAQPIATRAGLDRSTVVKWLRRRTRRPEVDKVRRLADGYALPLDQVLALIQRDIAREALGQAVPMPDLSRLRRGAARRTCPCPHCPLRTPSASSAASRAARRAAFWEQQAPDDRAAAVRARAAAINERASAILAQSRALARQVRRRKGTVAGLPVVPPKFISGTLDEDDAPRA